MAEQKRVTKITVYFLDGKKEFTAGADFKFFEVINGCLCLTFDNYEERKYYNVPFLVARTRENV